MCNMIEVIKDINFDGTLQVKVSGERGTESFVENHLFAPKIEEYGKVYAERVRKYSRRCTKVYKARPNIASGRFLCKEWTSKPSE